MSPALYFVGLTWQHTRGSALLGFVNHDAAHLAGRIIARTKSVTCRARAFKRGAKLKMPQGRAYGRNNARRRRLAISAEGDM